MTSGLPLSDCLHSNANPPNSSEQDNAWLGRPTTPLRIAKRDSPQGAQLARRQSSSYKHLRVNNLVSKSPFRSQLPTPSRLSNAPSTSPRKVSGEKRPRPHSMVATENDHPHGFKRRQSRAFQGLLEKGPVTKSPFKKAPDPDLDDALPPPPPPMLSRIPMASASPGRSSLVSKRLHGPRNVNGSLTRRQRRKTVTFDERCDVVEFDVEEDELDENAFETDDEDDEEQDVEAPPAVQPQIDVPTPTEESFDSSHTGNDSITGLVESLLSNGEPQTPPHQHMLPLDTETEDGLPLGRSHHAERLSAAYVERALTPPRSRSPTPVASTPTRELSDQVNDDVQLLPPSPSPSPAKRAPRLSGSIDGRFLLPRSSLEHLGTQAASSREDFFALPHDEDSELSFTSGSGGSDCMDPANLSIGQSEVSLEGLDREHASPEEETPEEELLPPQPPFFTMKHEGGCSSPRASTPLEQDRCESSFVSIGPDFRFTSPVAPSRSNSPRLSVSPRGEIAMPRAIRPGELTPERIMPLQNGSAASSSASSPRSSLIGASAARERELPREHPLREESCGQSSGVEEPRTVALPSTADTDADVDPDASHDDTSTESEESEEADMPPPMSREKHMTYDGVMTIEPEPQPIDPPRPTVLARASSAAVDSSAFHGIEMEFDQSGFGLEGDPMFGKGGSSSHRSDVHLSDVSALDRLMKNVAHGMPSASTAEGVQAPRFDFPSHPDDEHIEGTINGAGRSVVSSAPPAPPPQDAIRARQELIKAKKREARRKDELSALGYSTPSRVQALQAGRPSRRRSMSTGDAEDLLTRTPAAQRRAAQLRSEGLLDAVNIAQEDDLLTDSIDRELRKLEGPSNSKYRVRQHEETIYASSDDKVSHVGAAGDVDGGKAWRTVKRPSDMNEYAKQIKELRAQDKSGKAHGKVFVKVVGLKGVHVPVPHEPTVITCTLNNGIHFVTTPECRFNKDCRIDQEFELIEHSKLEFTLNIKVRRDPHIVAQFKANTPPKPTPLPVAREVPPASKGGMLNFFRSSAPKKPVKPSPPPTPRVLNFQIVENLARYLKPDGNLARAFISFRDVAHRCDTRLFETSYPLIGQRLESRSSTKTVQVGEIILQLFRLPPLPGIPLNHLPQSLEECHRGLRHTQWHKITYFEGTLTQNGGDCASWRRRHLRLVGANLVAYNDVTKKVTATIDLRKAIAVEDDEAAKFALSPASGVSGRSRYVDEVDIPYGAERSFRLVFLRDQEITFFADTEEEKAKWVEVLRALVGRIPPNPLWAEMLWQRQQEVTMQILQPHR